MSQSSGGTPPGGTPASSLKPNGYFCTSSSQCQSTYCSSNTCKLLPAPPPATSSLLKANGSTCSTNSQCQSDNCQAAQDGKYCIASGLTVNTIRKLGQTCGTSSYDRSCDTGLVCKSNVCQKLTETTIPADPFIVSGNPAPKAGEITNYLIYQTNLVGGQLGSQRGSQALIVNAAQGILDQTTSVLRQGACAGIPGALGFYQPQTCQNLTFGERVALAGNVATFGGLQGTTQTFNNYASANAQANQYGLAWDDPRRLIQAGYAGVAVTGFTAEIASPFINPQTVAGRPLSSTGVNARNYINNYLDDSLDSALPSNISFGPSGNGQPLGTTLNEYTTFRQGQSNVSRIAEYTTGIPTEDPALLQRIIDDHFVIKEKYGLPPRAMRFEDPQGYARELERIAQENDIAIRPGSEAQAFFNSTNAGGVSIDDFNSREIFVKLQPQDDFKLYQTQLGTTEHELIHALQSKRYPSMPIEGQEYEAYVGANTSLTALIENPADITDRIFGFEVSGSSSFWYKDKRLIAPWRDTIFK